MPVPPSSPARKPQPTSGLFHFVNNKGAKQPVKPTGRHAVAVGPQSRPASVTKQPRQHRYRVVKMETSPYPGYVRLLLVPYDAVSKYVKDNQERLNMKMEITTSFGVQAGIASPIASLDLNIASVKLSSDELSYDKGKFTSAKQLGPYKISADSARAFTDPTPTMEVSNEIGLKIFGYGGSVGQTQEIDEYYTSHNSKQFIKLTGGVAKLDKTTIREYKYGQQISSRQEDALTFGIKFLLGIELKIYHTSARSAY